METLIDQPLVLLGCAVAGYLLGSIPFGVIATRLGGAGDVRDIGSGNIGATNVLRTGRKDLALLTLVGDAGKAAIALLVARALAGELAGVVAGGAAFLGHLFPIYLKFKGGKGVSSFFGLLLAGAWPVGLLAAATWLAMAYLLRFSSLAALTAAALAPLFAFATDRSYAVIALTVFMGVLIYIRHADNIGRLLKGEESKIGGSKTPA
ncbi:MAG TPA: glycerol-3-phosphate 1-O-acyltransferase PlsY [Phenylobacterium sp.]|nr:glycerol-3-phosphate 1-O-acyltransferase PlsY [Phenylobacterium sp.]